MPETKIKIAMNDQTVDAVDVPIADAKESWNEYKLEDGTILRIKFTVGSIIRLVEQRDPEGNPIYSAKGSLVTIPIVPESMMQKKD